MRKKRGVSLVVLVITIVVIIILSSTVILNLSSGDGQISQAQMANIKSNIVTFRDELNIKLSENPRENFEDIDIDKLSSSEEDRVKILIRYIPSMYNAKLAQSIEYSSILTIQDGELKLYDIDTLNAKNIILEDEVKQTISEFLKIYEK